MESRTHTNLKIFSLDNFIPERPKPNGANPGAVGYFEQDDQKYMLKLETERYGGQVCGKLVDVSAIESFISQLIRSIWGPQFVADIHLVKVNHELPYFFSLEKISEKPMKIDLKYCVASAWVENSKALGLHDLKPSDLSNSLTDSESIHLTKIQTIARLLNVSDYKPLNMLYTSTLDTLFIVDCIASLYWNRTDVKSCSKELFNPAFGSVDIGEKYFQKRIVIETVKQLVAFKDLHLVLDQYKEIMSNKSLSMIENCFKKIHAMSTNFINSLENSSKVTNTSIFQPSSSKEEIPEKDILKLYEFIYEQSGGDITSFFTNNGLYTEQDEVKKNVHRVVLLGDDGSDVAYLASAIALLKGIPYAENSTNIKDVEIKKYRDLNVSAGLWGALKSQGYEIEKVWNILRSGGFQKEIEDIEKILNREYIKRF